jgi:hypothetical protein
MNVNRRMNVNTGKPWSNMDLADLVHDLTPALRLRR